MISVITPSYNQASYIRETIDSVLLQALPDMEYIIMDGGSTDDTVEILKSYGDRIYWESKRDKGQTDAVNQGIRKAHGDIIGWLNSDDIYYPSTLKTVQDFFDSNPACNVIYGNANHIDAEGAVLEEYYTEDFNYERLKEVCFICQPALFFRKKLVEQYGYLDDHLLYCMDYEYWLRLGQREQFQRIPQLFAGSRLYAENKTLGDRRKVHEEMVRMLKKKFRQIPPRWIYNLAHVICDDLGIPREINGRTNPDFARRLSKESFWLFLRYQGYIPKMERATLMEWKAYSKRKD